MGVGLAEAEVDGDEAEPAASGVASDQAQPASVEMRPTTRSPNAARRLLVRFTGDRILPGLRPHCTTQLMAETARNH